LAIKLSGLLATTKRLNCPENPFLPDKRFSSGFVWSGRLFSPVNQRSKPGIIVFRL